jgi:putative Mg2+ transporter-C (MgtC) family protein
MNGLEQVAAALHEEIVGDFRDVAEAARFVVRLLAALLLGGLLGLDRQHMGKAAGLRTHMLVALGAAVIVVAAHMSGAGPDGISRVIQGALAGIGFIGGGAILKLSDRGEIQGITTAASIWLTATVGLAAGAGRIGLATVGALLAFAVLTVLRKLEERLIGNADKA